MEAVQFHSHPHQSNSSYSTIEILVEFALTVSSALRVIVENKTAIVFRDTPTTAARDVEKDSHC
jgi:hypothetical protein